MVGINVADLPAPAPALRAWLVGALPPVGVFALQGDVREHVALLRELGADVREVRTPAQLDEVAGLVIPGGESSVMGQAQSPVLAARATARAHPPGNARPTARALGSIMLADRVHDGIDGQQTLGGLDIAVRRNAFGNQLDSFETALDVPVLGEPPVHAVFIRAPVVDEVGAGRRGARTARRRPHCCGRTGVGFSAPRSTPKYRASTGFTSDFSITWPPHPDLNC